MALHIITEWLARIEHKVDILLKAAKPDAFTNTPLHFVGSVCPVCSQAIDYQIDPSHSVVVRRCGCKTGKVPMTIPLVPVLQGEAHGKGTGSRPLAEDAPDRRGGEDR